MASGTAVNRSSASAGVGLAFGRYTDLDYAASEPGDTTPALQLTDRLVWVLIEHERRTYVSGPREVSSRENGERDA